MSDMGQDDIDKLLADALGGGASESEASEDSSSDSEESPGGAQSQDDIDALFAQMQNGDSADESPSAEEPPADDAPAEEDGVASQDDIDALFAQMGQEGGGDADPAAVATPAPESDPEPAEERKTDSSAATQVGLGDQDDIDALLAGMDSSGDAPPSDAEAASESEEDSGPQGQDDIDALLAGMGGDDDESADEPVEEAADAEPEPEDDSGAQGQDDIDALLAGMGGDDDAPAEDEVAQAPEPEGQDDIDALVSSLGDAESSIPTVEKTPEELAADEESDTAGISASDAGDVFAQLAASSDEPPADDAVSEEPQGSGEYEDFLPKTTQPDPAPVPPPAQPTPAPVAQSASRPVTPQQQIKSIAESLSLMGSAGEVENIAGQMASLLGQLSERARQYQHTWLSADQEAKELRSRLAASERRCNVFESELTSLREELGDVRKRSASLEGQKLAAEETHQTETSALRVQLREQESRNQMYASEVKALKEELDRTCTEATGADLESRRSRFETDRLRSEVESERMERLRLQRALENREKEIQAMQAQSAGQASSLFLDELHRLVRRLESQLEGRTASAHEALSLLDKLIVSEDMVPVESNLRAALQAAAGLDEDSNDALGQLSRDAGSVRGPAREDTTTPDEQQVDMVSFETALSAFDLDRAHNIATTLIRNGQSTGARVMEKVYRCPSLRRPEVAAHLDGLVHLLKSLRAIQEQADKRRGQEGSDSNRFYVQMFDYLHNLVRLKLISRSTHDAWGFFLDIRGRFSFVTSDRQWADYRDGVLNA